MYIYDVSCGDPPPPAPRRARFAPRGRGPRFRGTSSLTSLQFLLKRSTVARSIFPCLNLSDQCSIKPLQENLL